MIDVLWQSTLGIVLLFSTYKILFSQLTFFRINRIILLSIPIASIIITFIRFPSLTSEAFNAVLPGIEVSQSNILLSAQESISSSSISLILTVYITGLILSTLALVFKFLRLINFLHKLNFQKRRSSYISNSSDSFSSFSFFNFIHINESDIENESLIILHEEVHFKLFHSVDNLLMECLKCLFWFNPLIYILHKELRKVHEYEVDEQLTEASVSLAYMDSLTNESHILREMQLTNPYKSNSNLLNRMKMMYKKPNQRFHKVKYLALIPVIFSIVFAVSCSGGDVTSEPNEEVAIEEELFPTDRLSELSQQPTFPGGNQELMVFLGDEIKYPEDAKEEGIMGKVLVSFVVSKDGSIKNVQIKQGIHPLLDQEAIRAISSMPDWTPGEFNGDKVAVEFLLPVMFTFDKEEETEASQEE